MPRTTVYLIEIYSKNEGFEARSSIPEGRWLEEVVNSGTIHGLASKAAEKWELSKDEVKYTTISQGEFNPTTNTSRDPITGQQMKDFHYWFMLRHQEE